MPDALADTAAVLGADCTGLLPKSKLAQWQSCRGWLQACRGPESRMAASAPASRSRERVKKRGRERERKKEREREGKREPKHAPRVPATVAVCEFFPYSC